MRHQLVVGIVLILVTLVVHARERLLVVSRGQAHGHCRFLASGPQLMQMLLHEITLIGLRLVNHALFVLP